MLGLAWLSLFISLQTLQSPVCELSGHINLWNKHNKLLLLAFSECWCRTCKPYSISTLFQGCSFYKQFCHAGEKIQIRETGSTYACNFLSSLLFAHDYFIESYWGLSWAYFARYVCLFSNLAFMNRLCIAIALSWKDEIKIVVLCKEKLLFQGFFPSYNAFVKSMMFNLHNMRFRC